MGSPGRGAPMPRGSRAPGAQRGQELNLAADCQVGQGRQYHLQVRYYHSWRSVWRSSCHLPPQGRLMCTSNPFVGTASAGDCAPSHGDQRPMPPAPPVKQQRSACPVAVTTQSRTGPPQQHAALSQGFDYTSVSSSLLWTRSPKPVAPADRDGAAHRGESGPGLW